MKKRTYSKNPAPSSLNKTWSRKKREVKKTEKSTLAEKTRNTRLAAFLIGVVVLFIVIQMIENKCLIEGEEAISYYKGVVQTVLSDNSKPDESTEGVRRGTQELEVRITNGPYKDTVVNIKNYMSALYNVYGNEGTRLIIRATMYEDGPNFTIYNYDRSFLLYGVILLFVALLAVIGGKKGIMALISLGFTMIVVFKILLPLLIIGYPALLATIAIIIITTLFSFIMIDGINKKTVTASIGTLAGVLFAGFLSWGAGIVGHVSGFQMQEAESLLLIAGNHGMKVKDLLICGILIASLGAVMDVAMSIASSVHELHEVNQKMTANELFRSGMNIGKDAMGTMANTLILAFTGSSLNLLLMIYSYGISYTQLISTDIIAIEIIRGIAGSIGIVLTVPAVAFLSSFIETRR
ncbi:MAG: YibE/F family protein [Lachnospiraceae bacterium]|nr:YibE/F family protein [Lachnospiraceae bacterium]